MATLVAVAGLLALSLPAEASAAPGPAGAAAGTSGPGARDVRLSRPVDGRASYLLTVRYPLEAAGREAAGRVTVTDRRNGRQYVRKWKATPHSGSIRTGDTRSQFTFVHAVTIGPKLSRALWRSPRSFKVRFSVSFAPPQADGPLTFDRVGSGTVRDHVAAAPAGRCSSVPLIRAKGGTVTRGDLPRCGKKVKWAVSRQPSRGSAQVTGSRFAFRSKPGRSGPEAFELTARRGGRVVARRTVQARLSDTPAGTISVRAMGDSVTAGFGYYGATGKLMPITRLPDCEPGATVYNDACSSNSSNTSNQGSDPNYLNDYGLARNISWAAQWANAYGITDYKNYAVSGSAPVDWLPNGQFHDTLQSIETQDPDYVVMTMGANPLLSDMLFGIDEMGCAVESDLFGGYKDCIEAAFASVDLSQRLNALYTELVQKTTSRIVLMQYHLSIPSSGLAYSSAQIELMGQLLNEVIAYEAGQVSTSRIQVVAPPRFFVGIDMEPLYPSKFSCSWLGYQVDGPSVQADPSQDELLLDHPLSFCSGPAVGPPWVISGDTGIHPSAAGYFQMAGQVPPPE